MVTSQTHASPLNASPSSTLIVGLLAVGGIVVSLAQTLVVPIIGSLPEIFNAPASTTSWIVTITLLSAAVSTPVAGRLADMYGKKPMLLIALIPFLLGSLLCAVAWGVWPMIIGRALQGLATGFIPLGISLLHDVLPREKVGGAMALMSSSLGIGGALGLPIAAAVTQWASWRVLFWVIAAASAVLAILVAKLIPSPAPIGSAHRFDGVGTVGLSVGLIGLLLAVSKGSEWGWASAATLGCFAGAVIVLLLWGWYELRRPAPLVDLRTTVRPVVLLTNIASILIGFGMYAMNLVVPQVLQLPVELGYGLGQTMLQMGLWIAPMGLGMMAVSKLGARISNAKGPKVTLIVSSLVIAGGYALAAIVLGTIGNREPGDAATGLVLTTLILLVVATTLTGCGIGLGLGSMPALILSGVPASEKAAANSFNSLMRSFGSTVAAAVIGVVLASAVQTMGGRAIPTVTGFIISLCIAAGTALIAAIVAAVIPGRPAAVSAH